MSIYSGQIANRGLPVPGTFLGEQCTLYQEKQESYGIGKTYPQTDQLFVGLWVYFLIFGAE